ncbi:MAG: MurR/RpiR family transcriptional regulator [Streptococcaceae bacterium]|nr:MurR/RpiR family transcriptional regulator [Streptococcaceae bacterium]
MAFLGKVDFKKLTETEKSIYNYLRDNFEKIPYMHVRDIALEAHAGSSSVMRLIHKLGYDSYYNFQEFVENQQMKSTADSDMFRLLSASHYPAELIGKCRQLSEMMIKADSIIFFGLGASGNICRYATRRFATLNLNASALTDMTYPLDSRLIESQDSLIIVFSISGETGELLEVLQHVKNKDKVLIASVTPHDESTLARISDISINYKVEERRINLYGDLTSQIPAIFIIEVLSEMILEEK